MKAKLVHQAARGLLVGLVVASLGSCVLRTDEIEVLQGNQAFGRGDYQEATVHYLAALAANPPDRAWVEFNLGTVYLNLGERDAALRAWDVAARTADAELMFYLHYNRACAAYQQGDFTLAANLFREALLLRPDNIDAKRNLELCGRKTGQKAGAGPAPVAAPPPASAASPGAELRRIYDYVTEREGQVWRGRIELGTPGKGDTW